MPLKKALRRTVVFVSALSVLSGCAQYASRIRQPRLDFEMGRYEEAAEKLREYADKQDNDELLYLMDLGLVYHGAGKYKEAIEVFLKADKLAEIKDYTSLSAEAGSVLLNDEIKPYKGEDFEKILINVYLAIDYTLLGDWDNALVECRRVNHKLDLMISQGKLPYEHNAFAKYLAAALFETRREYNDAFVDYRQLLKWNVSGFSFLGPPLLRVADRLKMTEEFEQYQKEFPGADWRLPKGYGEVVLLLEQGKAPYKVPSPEFHLVPIFQRNGYVTRAGRIGIVGKPKVRTEPLFDIESTAIRELEKKSGAIIAKKLAGIAAKEVAAEGVRRASDSDLLGALTRIFLHVSDTADLRSWTTLPASLQIARFPVPAGRHDFSLDMLTSSGAELTGVRRWTGVEVKAGQIVFLNHRSTD